MWPIYATHPAPGDPGGNRFPAIARAGDSLLRPPVLLALIVGALALAALAGSGIHAQSQGEPQNLLPNGGFEQGDSGWVTDGATIVVVHDAVHMGAAAGKVSSLNAGAFFLMTKYLLAPAQARAEHTLHVWLRTDAHDPDDTPDSEVTETEVRLEFVDTSGAEVPAINCSRA